MLSQAQQEIREIRRKRFAKLLKEECGDSRGEMVRRVKRSEQYVSAILKKKNIGEESARHIEECFKKPPGWLSMPDVVPPVIDDPQAASVAAASPATSVKTHMQLRDGHVFVKFSFFLQGHEYSMSRPVSPDFFQKLVNGDV